MMVRDGQKRVSRRIRSYRSGVICKCFQCELFGCGKSGCYRGRLELRLTKQTMTLTEEDLNPTSTRKLKPLKWNNVSSVVVNFMSFVRLL